MNGGFNRQSGVFTVGWSGFDCSDAAALVFVTATGQLIRHLNKLMIAQIDFFFFLNQYSHDNGILTNS